MDTQSGFDPNTLLPPVNPADLTDPENQRKTAANVLSQLGLHPDQAGARNLLDLHFQGPTADPAVKQLIPTENSTSTATIPEQPLPTIPGPSYSSPTFTSHPTAQDNSNNALLQDQNELHRLISTGSGISQVKNPFLRALGHVGEIASDIVTPNLTKDIPGTEAHHDMLIGGRENLIKSDLANQGEEASVAHTNQETTDLQNAPDKNPDELAIWLKQNPDKPISEYWKQKAAAQGGKLTPEEMNMRYLTSPIEEGGAGLTPEAAFIKSEQDKSGAKPETANQTEKGLEALLAKAMPNGVADPKLMSDPVALGKTISQSPQLTDPEKAQLYSHFVFKTSPASAGGIASTRTAAIMNSRLTPAIDNSVEGGQLALTTPAQVAAHPGRFIPATQGGAAEQKQSVFSDIHFNVNNVAEAMNNLKNGFDDATRAQLALALRSPQPHSAFDAFMHSSVAKTLTPDQVDYVTAIASLNENAMALRSIAGMGAGSDELRAAIMRAIPGSGTPDPAYGKRQLDLFNGTVSRLEQGVPKTGIKQPEAQPVPKTGEPGKFEWKSPDGKQTITFKSQQDLDAFKKEAGIK